MNILGIDFEEWFHPELIQDHIQKEQKIPKVINGIEKILELLRKKETSATFFVVGEILEMKPELIDHILNNGHEIGFHTMKHTRIDKIGFEDEFRSEMENFKKLTNNKSKGFRAPSFSLNEKSSWVIDVLEEYDYEYDSSVVPAKTKLYGLPDAEKNPYHISSNSLLKNDKNGKILEFPLLTSRFLGKVIPAGGGFYLRTLPLRVIKNAIKKYEAQNMPAVFYIHSWELTPEHMPRIKIPKKDYFITYHNIDKAYNKMETLLENFEFTSFSKYISNS